MSTRAKLITWIFLGFTAAFAAAVIALEIKRQHEPEIGSFKPVPDFQLTERTGKTVTLAELKGKVWLADFIYSTCPGPCPMISSKLAELQKEALQNPDVRLVSFSTNPENDTPEVLRAYAERFHATDKWLFLTGDKAKVYNLIQNGFALAVVPQNDAKNPVIHSTKIALVDKKGMIRKFYDGASGEGNEEILHDIERLARE